MGKSIHHLSLGSQSVRLKLQLLDDLFLSADKVTLIGLILHRWHYYIIYVVILLITTLICWLFYPETKVSRFMCRPSGNSSLTFKQGYSLEQVAIVFDGPAADLHSGIEHGSLSTEARREDKS